VQGRLAICQEGPPLNLAIVRFVPLALPSVNSLLPGTEQIFPPAMSQNIWPFRQQQEQENI